ncbi:MAG: hypothetical protein F4186_09790 [Boseongicola sp. SB0676_bin_33]|uniref:Uncharacterized protein n=1 Tax=Boseongicola sp. SB0664_bin_43 TaxID=2604844 RepID=A0A6B0Y3N8_9RHOB|nr:hypothetical protein [Boseongicola sp. SB0664_bin_43]MYF89599.1 hypothetical protein [Boseongicola sp. SB0676_bin_33]
MSRAPAMRRAFEGWQTPFLHASRKSAPASNEAASLPVSEVSPTRGRTRRMPCGSGGGAVHRNLAEVEP